MQENKLEFTADSCRNYYEGLSKKDKGEFLKILCSKYKLSQSTMQAKFKGYQGHTFTFLEICAVVNLVEDDWRKEIEFLNKQK